MSKKSTGTIYHWRSLSPQVAIFRLKPQAGRVPDYKAGQYISLHRENCRMIKRIGVGPDGQSMYGPDLDETGNPRLAPVTNTYSISSAPYVSRTENYLEFYVNLEKDDIHYPGKPVECLFLMDLHEGSEVTYSNFAEGNFTLEDRTSGFQSVWMVGTGTGLAPFVSMIKELYHRSPEKHVQYTLIHANRRYEELGYHKELTEIEASGRLNFLYLPMISRPTERDWKDPSIGKGRASNLLRRLFQMALQESDSPIEPILPSQIVQDHLKSRIIGPKTVILACGNPLSVADVKYVADTNQVAFEKEDW